MNWSPALKRLANANDARLRAKNMPTTSSLNQLLKQTETKVVRFLLTTV